MNMDHPDDDGLGLEPPLGLEEKPAFSTFEKAVGQLALDVAGALCKFAKEFGFSPEETLFPKVKKGRKGEDKEKRKRAPSDYNRYVSETVKEIKAQRPEIQMKEAFKMAGEKWKMYKAKHGLAEDSGPGVKKRKGDDENGDGRKKRGRKG